MKVKDFISKLIDNYQKIVISEWDNHKPTGRNYTIEPHAKNYTNIPEDICGKEIVMVTLYFGMLSLEVQA